MSKLAQLIRRVLIEIYLLIYMIFLGNIVFIKFKATCFSYATEIIGLKIFFLSMVEAYLQPVIIYHFCFYLFPLPLTLLIIEKLTGAYFLSFDVAFLSEGGHLYLCGFQVVVSQVEAYFMSEQATICLGYVGLLGEYCPTLRRKCSDRVDDCMHLDLFQQGHLELSGCTQIQPFLNKFWAKGSSGNP